MLDLLAVVLGSVCFFGCMDRLRQISWQTTRPSYVTAYLACTLWSVWIVSRAMKSDVEAYQLIGVLAAIMWLVGSRNRWRNGPPADVSRPTPLDPPLRRFSK